MRPLYKLILLVMFLALLAVTAFMITHLTDTTADPNFHKIKCCVAVDLSNVAISNKKDYDARMHGEGPSWEKVSKQLSAPERTYISYSAGAAGELYVARIEEKKDRIILHIGARSPKNCGSREKPCGVPLRAIEGTIPHTDKPVYATGVEGEDAEAGKLTP